MAVTPWLHQSLAMTGATSLASGEVIHGGHAVAASKPRIARNTYWLPVLSDCKRQRLFLEWQSAPMCSTFFVEYPPQAWSGVVQAASLRFFLWIDRFKGANARIEIDDLEAFQEDFDNSGQRPPVLTVNFSARD